MTDTDVHSCGYYCDRPMCIKAQRDELREKLFEKKWVGLTAKDLSEIPASCYEGAIWADAKLKEKNG